MVGYIRALENLLKVIKGVKPSVVIHLAAQPLVIKSYQEPLETFRTNCIGTANVLKAAFDSPSVQIVLVITTDKVYRNDNSGKRFVESDPLQGNDPYSASKVAAEAVSSAWQQMSKFLGGPKVLVARAGNVIGGGDLAPNRLIPDIIRSVKTGQELRVRRPNATRPWQHVLDICTDYIQYIERALKNPEIAPSLNFGPIEQSYSVKEVIHRAKNHFKDDLSVNFDREFENTSESEHLQLDASLAFRETLWKPKWSQNQALDKTFSWWTRILSNSSELKRACSDDIDQYELSHF
jgi:CDP-glucose 4,6-dehydratase